MEKLTALALGFAAWAGVAALAVFIVFSHASKDFFGHNEILMFLPIAAAVMAAWTIGEVVTERVFGTHEEGV